MAEWVIAAERQLELHRWFTSGVGQRWVRAWTLAESRGDRAKADMYGMLSQAEPQKLLTAEAVWVAPEISDVIDVARESFRPESIEREDFIIPTGFLYFAKPLYMRDRNDLSVSVGAISWCRAFIQKDGSETNAWVEEADGLKEHTVEGICIYLYSSARAEGDDFSHTHRAAIRDGMAMELIPLHATVIPFGESLDEGEMIDPEGRYTGADQWWKLTQTTLRMMQQRVADRGAGPLPRSTRRRMQAARVGTDEVLVIRLRRPTVKTGEEEGSGREYTHRWLVDGHWRNQWFPASKTHRQIWISPYVKGPPDKELVVKKRFYKWDR